MLIKNITIIILIISLQFTSAQTIFKSPLQESIFDSNFKNDNPYTWKNYKIDPQEGNLIIFKSSLNHCVEPHKSSDTRITLAYNYDLK